MIMTDPHFPSTANGIEFSFLPVDSHEPDPNFIFIRFNFAFLSAFSLAGTVSFAFPKPYPTRPFPFPTIAYVEKLGLFPSFVFF